MLMFYRYSYFVISVKLKLLLQPETHCIDGEDKFQSVTDTENEFTKRQTTRKKLQSIGILPFSLHTGSQHSQITNPKMELGKAMSTLKSDISETYKVQIDCLEDSESDSYNKSDMKEKTNESIGLHESIKSSMLSRAKSKSLL